jgi:hypothetical protein
MSGEGGKRNLEGGKLWHRAESRGHRVKSFRNRESIFESGLVFTDFRFQVFSIQIQRISCLTPRMKLHEIKCHFREVPHAVTEYRFRRRPRTRPRPSAPIKF